jgi:hypothetical protein
MSYERYDSRRRATNRTTFGYWVPLVLTVTAVTFGAAAWIWKERKDSEEHEDRKDNRPPPGYGDVGPGQTAYGPGAYGPPGAGGPPGVPPPFEPSRGQADTGMMSKVSDVLRRTPSPQQFFDEASRRVTAGVAAAGAAFGSALSSIREEEKVEYEDHSRWSEEANTRGRNNNNNAQTVQVPTAPKSDRRKTVAVVVSAESKHAHDHDDMGYSQEHAVCRI